MEIVEFCNNYGFSEFVSLCKEFLELSLRMKLNLTPLDVILAVEKSLEKRSAK